MSISESDVTKDRGVDLKPGRHSRRQTSTNYYEMAPWAMTTLRAAVDQLLGPHLLSLWGYAPGPPTPIAQPLDCYHVGIVSAFDDFIIWLPWQ
ncbi:hypothetical protein [Micromonospora echinofusca]|uniref:Uncharacterized protein n=1 Tax=Micromonospora echinofusca TaxID=47858 RepID=A0ABS3VX23_MICEH|nr:hypothetical protein [Micromonospora echinofusca]MBO4209090.1 hypothetical protein [Micromonospora echinofusca]